MTSPIEIYARVLVCGPLVPEPEDFSAPYSAIPGSPTKHGLWASDINNVSIRHFKA